MHKLVIFIVISVFLTTLNAYESEDKLKVVIIGKVAKFIKWKDNNYDNFIITVLNNPYEKLFDKTFQNKKIKNKNIQIKYISNIDELTDTNILYIPPSNAKNLSDILSQLDGKNILTVSDIRGFAEKNGMMQIYFVSQKVKLKVNLDVAKRENLKISSSLLRIAKVIKEEKL